MSEEKAGLRDYERINCLADGKRFVAFESPPLSPPYIANPESSEEELGANLVCPQLRKKYDKASVDKIMGRLSKSLSGGSSVTRLFLQLSEDGEEGMNLVHAWFGANAIVESHSHPAFGDCLYYVVAGEAVMGKKRLGPGAVFFVPKGKSYRVHAGPVGLEILEFRVGYPEPEKPTHSADERTLESVTEVIENNERNQSSWHQPERIGDLAFAQKEYDVQQGGSS